MTTQATKIAITFPTKLIDRLKELAEREYGFDIPEMIRKLVTDYIDREEEWGPITAKMAEQYKKDIEETDELIKQGKIRGASTVEELKKQLDEEL